MRAVVARLDKRRKMQFNLDAQIYLILAVVIQLGITLKYEWMGDELARTSIFRFSVTKISA